MSNNFIATKVSIQFRRNLEKRNKALAKLALLGFAVRSACAVGQTPNVPMWAGIKLLTRPEKSLQFLLLILLFIYKVIFNPDIGLQFDFSLGNNSSRFVLLLKVLLHDELYRE